MGGHRSNGEYRIYQRRCDGRWLEAVSTGYSPEDRQFRMVVSARTRDEVTK